MERVEFLSFILEKAMRIVHNVGFRNHTKTLFVKSNTLKPEDLVKLQTLLMIIYKAKNNQLSSNIQKMCTNPEVGYNLRGEYHLKGPH